VAAVASGAAVRGAWRKAKSAEFEWAARRTSEPRQARQAGERQRGFGVSGARLLFLLLLRLLLLLLSPAAAVAVSAAAALLSAASVRQREVAVRVAALLLLAHVETPLARRRGRRERA